MFIPDPTLVAVTSLHGAPVAVTLATSKVVRAGQDLTQGGLGDLVQGRAGEAPGMALNRRAHRPAAGRLEGSLLTQAAVMVAGDLDTFPEIYLSHPAVRKEGL